MKKTHFWKVIRRFLLVLVLLFAGIQFIPANCTNPAVDSDIPAPAEVRVILRRACYDCHSNETVWPWYSHVAPVSWLVSRDVNKGREELNFSTWNRLTNQQQMKVLKELGKEVAEREMPPSLYVTVHWDATLSAKDRAVLRNWSSGPVSVAKK